MALNLTYDQMQQDPLRSRLLTNPAVRAEALRQQLKQDPAEAQLFAQANAEITQLKQKADAVMAAAARQGLAIRNPFEGWLQQSPIVRRAAQRLEFYAQQGLPEFANLGTGADKIPAAVQRLQSAGFIAPSAPAAAPSRPSAAPAPSTQPAPVTPAINRDTIPFPGTSGVGANVPERPQPFASLASSLSQQYASRTAERDLSQPKATTLDKAQPFVQQQAAQAGAVAPTVANPQGNVNEAVQRANTQIRSQRSGFQGNRRFHPFAGR